MLEMGIKARWIRPYTVTTKDSDFSYQLVNILNEQFNPDNSNAVWCSDIILEVSRVLDTIQKIKVRRNMESPLILHNDRGSQYVSAEYRKATSKMQLRYSKKAYPWDNACIESFHALIKRKWLNWFKFRNMDHAHRLVFEYKEAFYNTTLLNIVIINRQMTMKITTKNSWKLMSFCLDEKILFLILICTFS